MMVRNGIVHVYTGNGKGKTTLALGLAVRAASAGLKVTILQFIKAPGQSGEERLKIQDVTIRPMGLGFVGIMGDCQDHKEHCTAAKEAMSEAFSIASSGTTDLLVLDEINVAMHLGLVKSEDVLALISQKHPATELVLTGRNAPEEIIRAADLVTDMVEVKHPYNKGIDARKGIEF